MSLPSFTNYANQSAVSGDNYTTTTSGNTTPITSYYSQNPWAGLTANTRMYYDHILRDVFMKKSVFAAYCQYQQNLGAINAPTMQVTEQLPLHANFDAIGLRDQWVGSSHFDTRAIQITFAH